MIATPKKAAPDPMRTELWMARRLGAPDLFEGTTTAEDRRERIRNRIVTRGIAHETAGHRNGKPVAWRELYEWAFGVAFAEDDVSAAQSSGG